MHCNTQILEMIKRSLSKTRKKRGPKTAMKQATRYKE